MKEISYDMGRWATMQHECMTSHGRLAEKGDGCAFIKGAVDADFAATRCAELR